MKVFIHWDAKDDENLTPLLTACSWSGSRLQVARQLQFTFVQDDRDELVPKINIDCGYTIHGYDDEDNLVFVGNVYSVEKDRQKSSVTILARDHLHVLTRSKSTRKFTKALPEDIAAQICDEMGVIKGDAGKLYRQRQDGLSNHYGGIHRGGENHRKEVPPRNERRKAGCHRKRNAD